MLSHRLLDKFSWHALCVEQLCVKSPWRVLFAWDKNKYVYGNRGNRFQGPPFTTVGYFPSSLSHTKDCLRGGIIVDQLVQTIGFADWSKQATWCRPRAWLGPNLVPVGIEPMICGTLLSALARQMLNARVARFSVAIKKITTPTNRAHFN